MSQNYTAAHKQNPGRKSWLVEFRHPLKNDNNNKPGKKTRKGLGTEDEQEAKSLADQLNELLKDESLWSVASKANAAKRFDPRVVEIFYSEIESHTQQSSYELRNSHLPLPEPNQGYAKVALLGVPGAGKTTLLRQLIGTHPKKERFPSTSVNRTTTFPAEIIMSDDHHFQAVVTFMSEHETRFEIEESLSGAIMAAIDGEEQKVASTLLEKSDMRFRLRFILGELSKDEDEIDPYAVENEGASIEEHPDLITSNEEKLQQQALLKDYLQRIVQLAQYHKLELEQNEGLLTSMNPQDRNAALDLIQEQATTSDEFLSLTSEILEEIKSKFDQVSEGKFEKTTTGWPKTWTLKTQKADREIFLKSVRFFSGNAKQSWGKLLAPLVNGMRISGPFKPNWSNNQPKLMLIDTEGLGHKANATAELSEQTLILLHQVDVVLLVDSAKNSMTNFAAGKVLEAVVNSGFTQKLAITFTHMDAATEDNLKGQALREHIFGGVRNVVENQLANNVSNDAARHLLKHLEKTTFYVGKIDQFEPTPAIPDLNKLLSHLIKYQPPEFKPLAFPKYSPDNLVLAIQEASKNFRQQWDGLLDIAHHSEFKRSPWQSVKALSRRYAEGWGEDFHLRPISNLINALSTAISRFLENPIEWSGNPTEEQKRIIIDSIKAAISKKIPNISRNRLRDTPQPLWHEAYRAKGRDSTFDRSQRINRIFAQYVPIPNAEGNKLTFEFLNEIKTIAMDAIAQIKTEAERNS